MPHIPDRDASEIFEQIEDSQLQRMVCGRTITQSPPYPNTAVYQGRVIVFCTRYCLEAFLADPDRFFTAHSKSGAELIDGL